MIDATPIGANVRSTVATYSGVLDDLRQLFARTEAAKARGLTAGAFSYNTGSLRCPTCDGTGQITLDVQFLPDVDIDCPDCHGTARGLTAGAFSYNTGSLRCPTCDGTGQITLDVQFLPDVDIDCPDCHGTRYSDEAGEITWEPKGGHAPVSLPDLLAMTVDEALFRCPICSR